MSAPDQTGPLVFLVAGEPSGDNLGARLMAALQRRTEGRVRFAGVGGPAMRREGLNSLFPMSELSLMGLSEVLPHLPRLLRRLHQTAAEVRRTRPDVVVTVDSPDFTLRVAKRIRASGIPVVQYVAPQLWAWRPGRARGVARLVDHMLTVLPFEPAFFERFAIPSTYVGHPVLESGADRGDGDAFRHRHGLAPEAPLISVLPGSRQTEIARLLPIFRGALDRLAARHAGLTAVVSAPDSLREAVAAATRGWAVPAITVSDDAEKYDAFAASRTAITKSGTVTLELALARLPMVVCYKVNPSTAFLARRLIRVEHAALVNLIAERAVVPELLQGACTAKAIAEKTDPLMRESPARMTQEAAFREIVRRLGEASPAPSERAAGVVLRLARQGRVPSAGPLEARAG